jgi:hypothetical protein
MSVSRAHPPVLIFPLFTRDGRSENYQKSGANRFHIFVFGQSWGLLGGLAFGQEPLRSGPHEAKFSQSWGDAIDIDVPLWRTL